MTADRLLRLPAQPLQGSLRRLDARLASTPLARLHGLAWLRPDAVDAGTALLLPRTRSVHTFGMRFPLDLVWIGDDGRAVRVDLCVAPCRVRACPAAAAVLELPAGGATRAGVRSGSPVL